MRIIFIGTPDFAVESLKQLVLAKKNIVAVITAPDRKAGRGRKLNESAVKKYALEQSIPVLQPINLKNETFIEELRTYKADLQIVVAFRMMPEVVWNMPDHGTFNLHASLLPDYRGAAPINWAIINGDKESGVTTFFLKHKIDTGDIIFQERVALTENETAGSLHDKLMILGGKLVVKTVDAIEQDNYSPTPQSTTSGKEAPKIFKPDCKINWNSSAVEIDRLIRGMSPYPTAWTELQHLENGKKLALKIFEVEIVNHEKGLQSGTITTQNNEILIACKDDCIKLISLQLEGKKRMSSKDLLNGFSFNEYKIVRH